MHLIIASREDPHLPLGRLRGQGHLSELRGADLRFTLSEAGEFLTQMMGSSSPPPTLLRLTPALKAGLPACS